MRANHPPGSGFFLGMFRRFPNYCCIRQESKREHKGREAYTGLLCLCVVLQNPQQRLVEDLRCPKERQNRGEFHVRIGSENARMHPGTAFSDCNGIRLQRSQHWRGGSEVIKLHVLSAPCQQERRHRFPAHLSCRDSRCDETLQRVNGCGNAGKRRRDGDAESVCLVASGTARESTCSF